MSFRLKTIYILFIAISSISACKEEIQNPTITSQAVSMDFSSDPYISNTQMLLQGTWDNLQEKGVSIVFEGNTRIENIIGKPTGKTRFFEVADECKNDAAGTMPSVKARGKYISMQDIDLCYYVIKLNKNNLELKKVGRGNVLRYKKRGSPDKKSSDLESNILRSKQ